MYCPYCKHTDSRVVDSRTTDDGAAIRRRRQCTDCGRRFTTVETTSISVIKRSGVTEPFDRAKIASGVRKACQGRPVGEDDLAKLAQEVEERIRAKGLAEINAHEVGLTILEPLSKLDAVAYLRFASVYQAFENLEDLRGPLLCSVKMLWGMHCPRLKHLHRNPARPRRRRPAPKNLKKPLCRTPCYRATLHHVY